MTTRDEIVDALMRQFLPETYAGMHPQPAPDPYDRVPPSANIEDRRPQGMDPLNAPMPPYPGMERQRPPFEMPWSTELEKRQHTQALDAVIGVPGQSDLPAEMGGRVATPLAAQAGWNDAIARPVPRQTIPLPPREQFGQQLDYMGRNDPPLVKEMNPRPPVDWYSEPPFNPDPEPDPM